MEAVVRSFAGAGGITLIGDAYGEVGAAPVLLMHGGGQTRHAWGNTAETLAAAGRYVVSLDARGHGDSDWSPDADYTHDPMIEDARAVAGVLADEAGGRAPAFVGASMGGIISLLAIGERHVDASALVLVDIATRMEESGVDKILTFMRSGTEGFASVEEAADAVSAYQPHRPRPKDVSGLKKNLRQREDGRWYWHWDPAFMDPDGKTPRRSRDPDRLDDAARALTIPTLLVRGRASDVVSEEGARYFLELVPHAEYVDIADAHHMVAGDRNDAFGTAVVDFLTRE
ncbi:MAG: alpha/beta hydrolase [Actinomycetota bacterium]